MSFARVEGRQSHLTNFNKLVFCARSTPQTCVLCKVHSRMAYTHTHTWHLEVRGNAEVAGQARFAKRLITARRETREVRRTLRGVFAEMAVFVLRHIALPRRGTLSSVCVCVFMSVPVYMNTYMCIMSSCTHTHTLNYLHTH